MQTIIYQIVPNEWVTEKLLIAATGLKPGTILRARKESWLLGREYKHVAPGGHPKPTSECMDLSLIPIRRCRRRLKSE
ncbi:excisionase family protein, partial [Salmonella enterica]